MRMKRSHGMAREAKNKKFESQLIKKYKNLSPQFIFLYPTLTLLMKQIFG